MIPGGVALALLVAGVLTGIPESAAAPAALPGSQTAGLQVLITTSELVVGENRFAFGLLKDGTLLADARVVVRIYDIREAEARLTAEVPVPYLALEVVEQGHRVHIHPDGTRHLHEAATDVQGIHVAHVTFPRSGPWGLEVVAQHRDGLSEIARLSVVAVEGSRTPAPGMPAPRSRNLIASDVSDLSKIDSSDPPDPRLHRIRIADAIAQGKPQVIVFATPRYCVSRVCGPVVDVVRTLIPTYGHRVAFIHQEIGQRASLEKFSPTVEEWNLRTEPWIFLVDRDGVIRARFEGVTTRRELEAALKQMLGPR